MSSALQFGSHYLETRSFTLARKQSLSPTFSRAWNLLDTTQCGGVPAGKEKASKCCNIQKCLKTLWFYLEWKLNMLKSPNLCSNSFWRLHLLTMLTWLWQTLWLWVRLMFWIPEYLQETISRFPAQLRIDMVYPNTWEDMVKELEDTSNHKLGMAPSLGLWSPIPGARKSDDFCSPACYPVGQKSFCQSWRSRTLL